MIYARQIAIEDYTTGEQRINVYGNSRLISYTSEDFDRVMDFCDEVCHARKIDHIDNVNVYRTYWNDMLTDPVEHGYQNATDVIMEYIPPVKERYTEEDIYNMCLLFTDEDTYEERHGLPYAYLIAEENFLCEVLSIVCGEKWTWDVIRGSAQGDWNNVFYPAAAFTGKNIEQFKMLYFNEGTEWMVSDDLDEEPNSLDEIDGMNVYCCAWDADGVKEEIADVCGVSANEVKLYAFSRWARMPFYEAI